RAVGAHLDAGRPFRPAQAEVALGGQLHRLSVGPLLLGLDHHDVSPRAAVRAVAAADAGGLVDRDLERAHSAGDGSGRAVHHADGVGALVASGGDEPVAIALSLTDELGLAAVRVGAAAHALVAAGAGREVDEEDALAVDEAGLHGHLQVLGRDGI